MEQFHNPAFACHSACHLESTVPDTSPSKTSLAVRAGARRSSYATRPADIRLNPLRYFWYQSEVRPVFKIWLFAIGLVSMLCTIGWWASSIVPLMLGAIPLAISAYFGRQFYQLWRVVADIYRNADLTPGMVVSVGPLEFITLANMSTSSSGKFFAVKREVICQLPCHLQRIGTSFPCVSGFGLGQNSFAWGELQPHPLSFGTSNRKLIQARRENLGEDEFVQLQQIFENGLFPKAAGQLIWLNEQQTSIVAPPIPTI